MAKQNDNSNLKKLDYRSLANIFNIYNTKKLVGNTKIYNLNRTANIVGLDNIAEGNYFEYVIETGDTWPLISFKNYGTIKLWWLVLKMNGFVDPTVDPEIGTVLRLLDENLVNQLLTAIREK